MDIDGDGRRDILSGSYCSRAEKAKAGLFQVLYGKRDGAFRKAEVLNGTDGEPLIVPHDRPTWTEAICTRPFAVDWNGDGHLDLVVGNFAGTFYWFRGEGKGAFQPKPEVIATGGDPLRIEGHHSDPFAIDWDGDGDLKPGSATEGGNEEVLTEDQLTGPATSTRVWVADVNGDGKLDLLVGDSVTLISPAEGLSAKAFKKKLADWKKAYADAVAVLSSASASEEKRDKASAEIDKLDDRRAAFMQEDDTGFVWLYLQK